MRKIHNFTITGTIGDDAHFIKARDNYERLMLQQMRDKGYVPVLDMMPQFSLSYIAQKDQYGFVLIMFGVFVGKDKAKAIEGFSDQKFIPR